MSASLPQHIDSIVCDLLLIGRRLILYGIPTENQALFLRPVTALKLSVRAAELPSILLPLTQVIPGDDFVIPNGVRNLLCRFRR